MSSPGDGRSPVVLSACRTAIGTARRGSLVHADPFELAAVVVGEAVARAAVDPGAVDEVVLGESLAGGGDIARFAALRAGMTGAVGTAVNRHCASGLAAATLAAAAVRSGMTAMAVAGGVQSSSLAPRCNRRVPGTDTWEDDWLAPSHPETPEAPARDMSITVGWNAARLAGVTRAEMDAWALGSHRKAVAAIDAGAFVEEIVPVDVPDGAGGTRRFAVDEHPRRDTTLDKLAALPPLHPEIEGFSITAGNASGRNDGAGAMVVTSAERAAADGLVPLARILGWASVGVPPEETGLAPIGAIPKALDAVGRRIADVAVFEINEAFASMCVATVRALGLDPERVNPLGSGCSLGHPVAMTGVRMLTTMIHELRRRGGGLGVAAMCAGGGMGTAVVIEV